MLSESLSLRFFINRNSYWQGLAGKRRISVMVDFATKKNYKLACSNNGGILGGILGGNVNESRVYRF